MNQRFLRYFTVFLAVLLFCSAFLSLPAAALGYRWVPTETSRIALTFDDGPHPRLTSRILDILDRYGVRATFFMIGQNVEYYSDAAREVVARGHEIGNHTANHRALHGLSEGQMKEELNNCAEKIEEICGCRSRLFRPPEGVVDKTVFRIASEGNYEVILWSIDTRDWEIKDEKAIVNRVISAVKPGDIILMHDFIGRNSKTPEALEILLPKLLALGYEPVTVSELLGIG